MHVYLWPEGKCLCSVDCSTGRLVDLLLYITYFSAYFVSVVELKSKGIFFTTPNCCLHYNCYANDLYYHGQRLGIFLANSAFVHRKHISYEASIKDKCLIPWCVFFSTSFLHSLEEMSDKTYYFSSYPNCPHLNSFLLQLRQSEKFNIISNQRANKT